MRAYEDKKAREGGWTSHSVAKEALAALVGFEIGKAQRGDTGKPIMFPVGRHAILD
jgi:hypothetical protein